MISTNNLDTLLQEGMAKGNEELKRLQKEWKEIEKEESKAPPKKVSFADNQQMDSERTDTQTIKRDCSPTADQALSCTSSRSSSEDEEGLCLRFMERYSSVILRMDEILRKEMRKANVEFERLRKDWKRLEKKQKVKT